jgi:hypothetical protein
MRVNLSFNEDEYKEIAAKAGRERVTSYCRRVVLEQVRNDGGGGPTPLGPTEWNSRKADGPSPSNLGAERKNAKPLYKRPGRFL